MSKKSWIVCPPLALLLKKKIKSFITLLPLLCNNCWSYYHLCSMKSCHQLFSNDFVVNDFAFVQAHTWFLLCKSFPWWFTALMTINCSPMCCSIWKTVNITILIWRKIWLDKKLTSSFCHLDKSKVGPWWYSIQYFLSKQPVWGTNLSKNPTQRCISIASWSSVWTGVLDEVVLFYHYNFVKSCKSLPSDAGHFFSSNISS